MCGLTGSTDRVEASMSTLVLKLTSDALVRGMVAPDGNHRFSVYDFICIAAQKPVKSNYGRVTFASLISDTSCYKEEILSSCYNLHFPGGRGGATPTMTLRGLQRLLLHLGTKVAAEFRALLEGTFTRVMAGDMSLIKVIEANAASDAPLQQAYRQALEQEPIVEPVATFKRKREELELYKMETDLQKQRVECVQQFASMMDRLNPNWTNDPGVCRQLQVNLLGTQDNIELKADLLKGTVQELEKAIKEKDEKLVAAAKQNLLLRATVSDKERILNGLVTSREITKILEKDAFSISDVLGDRKVKDRSQFSKKVMMDFRSTQHPYFDRQGVIHFYACDRPLVEELVEFQLKLAAAMEGQP